MKLYEHQGKALFDEFGILTPQRKLVKSPEDALAAAEEIGLPVMLKAQILQGGRGKAGGINRVDTVDKIKELSSLTLSKKIKDEKVNSLLIEEIVNIKKEYYLGITVDDCLGQPVVVACSEGGIDIEDLVLKHPEIIVRYPVEYTRGLRQYEAIMIAKKLNLAGKEMLQYANILTNLYRLFEKKDAQIIEINPLIITEEGVFIACDAKITINDDALFRQKDFQAQYIDEDGENKFENKARAKGFIFVDMNGEIGVVSIGAGYGMMVLDTISHYGCRPANYMDSPGGITKNSFKDMASLVIAKAKEDLKVKVIIVTCSIGATPLEHVVDSIILAIEEFPPTVPIIANLMADGPSVMNMSLEEAGLMLKEKGVLYYPDFQDTIEVAVNLAKKGE